MNEKTLRKLFDYQKFSQNPHLDEVIKECETQAQELTDESLLAVTGGKTVEKKKEIKDE